MLFVQNSGGGICRLQQRRILEGKNKRRKLEKIRVCIDEDLSDRIAVAIKSKGFDVISTHEVDMRSKTDKEQLEYAKKHNRTILTKNIKHFVKLQREYYKDGLSHNGILVTDYLTLKELMFIICDSQAEKGALLLNSEIRQYNNYLSILK